MRLHENIELYKDAIVATAQLKKLPEIYIEKDYWVTVALHAIFTSEIGQTAMIDEYNLQQFPVNILSRERTLCEKIMSLVRFSFTPEPIADLSNKVRHIYDIHKLLTIDDVYAFFGSADFESMLLKVSADDIVSFRNNNEWLINHPSTAIVFSDAENTWRQIRSIYNTTFADLVYGELPTDVQLLSSLNEVYERLKSVSWSINPNNIKG